MIAARRKCRQVEMLVTQCPIKKLWRLRPRYERRVNGIVPTSALKSLAIKSRNRKSANRHYTPSSFIEYFFSYRISRNKAFNNNNRVQSFMTRDYINTCEIFTFLHVREKTHRSERCLLKLLLEKFYCSFLLLLILRE